MLAALTTLLVYQLAGEVVVLACAVHDPGPVSGTARRFATLGVRRGAGAELRDTANGLLAHLSLLFVPAGVGVMAHSARLGDEWLPIAVALVASTVLTIAVTAVTMRWLLRRHAPR